MIKFVNQEFNIKNINKTDIFICAFGYECRSMSLYQEMKKMIPKENIYAFVFNDYKKYNYISSQIDRSIEEKSVIKNCAEYNSGIYVCEYIKNIIQSRKKEKESITLHVDYSSMPRSWYYKLPFYLKNYLAKEDKLFFWYVSGKYPVDYEAYPSAGIDSFSVLGKPSLRTGMKRVHVIGLSYDTIRTSAMLSILDPDSYITCKAFDKENQEISVNLRSVNEQIISRASMVISLKIDDFSFMVSKLCEIANEYLPLGDVIFVPDGPKPLIFAMSVVPLLLEKPGITCLHVSRNSECYTPINVEPTDRIYGVGVE